MAAGSVRPDRCDSQPVSSDRDDRLVLREASVAAPARHHGPRNYRSPIDPMTAITSLYALPFAPSPTSLRPLE